MLEEGLAKGRIKDRLGAAEQQGRLLLALGRHGEAEGVYRWGSPAGRWVACREEAMPRTGTAAGEDCWHDCGSSMY